jgi:hypothetical protein
MSAGEVFVVAEVKNPVATSLLAAPANSPAARILSDVIAAHRARVIPESAIEQGPDTSLITIATPGEVEATALAEELRAIAAVQSAYVKPPAALP